MNEWRHVEEWSYKGSSPRCAVHMFDYGIPGDCACTTPTPDPSSPCGRQYVWTTGIIACMWFPEQHPTDSNHPHVPTLCTCGHPIRQMP